MSQLSHLKHILALLALTIALFYDVVSVSAQNHAATSCNPTSENYALGDAFQTSLTEVMLLLTTDAVGGSAFSNITAGTGIDQVFGLYYCSGAFNVTECAACVATAATEIQTSCSTKEAVAWYVQCTVRYANRDIFSKAEISPMAFTNLNGTVSNRTALNDVLTDTFTSVIASTASNTTSQPPAFGFSLVGLAPTETLLVVAQCTPDIVGPPCLDCLNAALANMTSCCTATVGGLVFLPSCELFYAVGDTSASPSTAQASVAGTPGSSGLSSFFTRRTANNTKSTAPSPESPESAAPSPANGKSKGNVLRGKHNAIAGILMAIGLIIFTNL